jgi:hypothetical protein
VLVQGGQGGRHGRSQGHRRVLLGGGEVGRGSTASEGLVASVEVVEGRRLARLGEGILQWHQVLRLCQTLEVVRKGRPAVSREGLHVHAFTRSKVIYSYALLA